MKAERIIFNISTYGALVIVLGILSFPAITSLAQAYSNGALSSAPVSEISLVDFWSHVFLNSDPGAMMSVGRGALSMLIFVASLLWLSVSRLRSGHGLTAGMAVVSLLLWGGLSAYFSVCFYESLLDVCSYTSIAALFFLVSSLTREFSLKDASAKTKSALIRVEKTANFALTFLQIIAFTVMVGALALYVCHPAADGIAGGIYNKHALSVVGISGSFYNKNILAAFLLMIIPCGLLRLATNCRELETESNSRILVKICVQALFVVFSLSLIILTYSRSCLILLCLLLASWGALFDYLSEARKSWYYAAGWGLSVAILLLTAVFLWASFLYLAFICILVAVILAWVKLFWGKRGGRALIITSALCLLAVWGTVTFVQVDNAMAVGGTQHLQQLGSSSDSSFASRYQFYKASLKMALAHPILGVGAGNFERFYPAYQTDFRWFSKRSHSLTCDLLAEGGVVSFVLFYLLMAFIFRDIIKKLSSDSPQLQGARLAWALGALIMLLHAQIDIDNHVFMLPVLGVTLLGLAWGMPGKLEWESNSYSDGWSNSQRYFISSNCGPVFALVIAFCISGQAWGGQYYSTIGKIYLDMGEVEKARQCYSWASEYDPKVGEYWRQMAVLTLNQCDSEARAKSLAQSIRFCALQAAEADPHRASVQSILGQGFEISGDLERAELSYKRSLELDSKNFPDSYANLARIYAQQGRIQEAKGILDNAFSVFTEKLLLEGSLFDFRLKDIKKQLVSCCLQRTELALLEKNEKVAKEYLLKACKLERSLSDNLKKAALYLLEQGRRLKKVGQNKDAAEILARASCFLSVVKVINPEDKEIEETLQQLKEP